MGQTFERKAIGQLTLIFMLALPIFGSSQYTDVINSNRPGLSVSAYAVGKNVIQAELGAFYEQSDHSLLNTQSNIWGTDLSLRYGLLFSNSWKSTTKVPFKTKRRLFRI